MVKLRKLLYVVIALLPIFTACKKEDKSIHDTAAEQVQKDTVNESDAASGITVLPNDTILKLSKTLITNNERMAQIEEENANALEQEITKLDEKYKGASQIDSTQYKKESDSIKAIYGKKCNDAIDSLLISPVSEVIAQYNIDDNTVNATNTSKSWVDFWKELSLVNIIIIAAIFVLGLLIGLIFVLLVCKKSKKNKSKKGPNGAPASGPNVKAEQKINSLRNDLDETSRKLREERNTNTQLLTTNKNLDSKIHQQDIEINNLQGELKEFTERAVVLKPDVQGVIEKAYDLQKDIIAAGDLALATLTKCAGSDNPKELEQFVNAVIKFTDSVNKCKNYNAYTSELRNIAFKGIIMKGSDLYEKVKDNIDKKETWLSILNSALFVNIVGGSIVMCEEIAIRLGKMYPDANLSTAKFGALAESIRTKAAGVGLKVDSAKPFESFSGTEGWESIDFSNPHDGLTSGQIDQVVHLGVRYGNSQDKTTVISVN